MNLIKVKERLISQYAYNQLRKDIESYQDMDITVKNVPATKEFIEFLTENYDCFDSEPLEAILKLYSKYPSKIMKIDFKYEDNFCMHIHAGLNNGEEYTWSC